MPYYNNAAADGDIANDANWWDDEAFTIPSSLAACNGVDCFIRGDVSVGAIGYTPNSTTIESGTWTAVQSLNGAVLITGTAIFASPADITSAGGFVINGGASVTGGQLQSVAGITISGNATAVGCSMIGNVLSTGSSLSQLTTCAITGNLTFDGDYTDGLPENGSGGTVSSNVLFTGSATFTAVGNAVSPTWTGTTSTWTFNAQANSGSFECSLATFNTGSTNSGTITGDAVFNASVNDGGTVVGAATFNGAFTTTTFAGTAGSYALGATFTLTLATGEWMIDTTAWTINAAATFTFTEANLGATGVLPRATFLNGSSNTGNVTGNASMFSGTNSGTVGSSLTITGGGTNTGGTVADTLTIPLRATYSQAELGTYGALVIRAPGGGGGALGGPGIEL